MSVTAPAARLLRAARREGVEHADGRRFESPTTTSSGCRRICSRDSPNHDPAPRSALRQPQHAVVDVRDERALGEVVVADAEIPLVVAVLLERSAQRVRLVERVIEPAVEVDAIRRPAHRRRCAAPSGTAA